MEPLLDSSQFNSHFDFVNYCSTNDFCSSLWQSIIYSLYIHTCIYIDMYIYIYIYIHYTYTSHVHIFVSYSQIFVRICRSQHLKPQPCRFLDVVDFDDHLADGNQSWFGTQELQISVSWCKVVCISYAWPRLNETLFAGDKLQKMRSDWAKVAHRMWRSLFHPVAIGWLQPKLVSMRDMLLTLSLKTL